MTDRHPDDELGALLSAYLDGEVTDDERAQVERLAEEDPAVRAELDGLAEVRSLVRGLPPVEPPAGTFDRPLATAPSGVARPHLRRARRRRPTWRSVGGAVTAVAAAVVVLLGVTPVTDAISPPVTAFAARHEQMDVPADAGTVPSMAPSSSAATGDFDAMGAAELGAMGGPYVVPPSLPGGWYLSAAYHSDEGTVHLMFRRGTDNVSIYQQVGVVRWESLPDGQRMAVGGSKAWEGRPSTGTTGSPAVIVVERPPLVYTVVARTPHDDMMAVAEGLPQPAEPGWTDRARRACASITERFGLGSG